jgi:hypothetical protein
MQDSAGFWSSTGLMPKDGPTTMFNLLATFQPDLKKAHDDLSKTYTNQFVLAAQKLKAPAARPADASALAGACPPLRSPQCRSTRFSTSAAGPPGRTPS